MSTPDPALLSAAQALQAALAAVEEATRAPVPPAVLGGDRLLTARQVAGVLGLSVQHTYALMQANRLPAVRIGRAVRVPEHLLRAYLHDLIGAGAGPRAAPAPTPRAPIALLRPTRLPAADSPHQDEE
jgi:excisionase family DNA binding protein